MNALAPLVATVQRRPSAAILVGVPLLAAVLGAALAWALRGDDQPSAHRTPAAATATAFAVGDLELALPDGWREVRSGPVVPGFDPARTRFVASVSSQVAFALLPPESPTLLPAALAARQDAAALAPRILRAGDVQAYHYVTAIGANRVIDVFAAPTTRGTATVACSTSVYELGECQSVVAGMHLARGSFLPPSPDAAFLERLPDAMATLNADRATLRARLAQAATPAAGARVANRLAVSYASAGRALRPLLGAEGPARATVRLLDRLRAEHVSLAAALATQDRTGFARAAGTIAAHEARLAKRLDAWQRSLPR
ncbi:MAG TPA: hypothetical protein VF257_02975 [Solirubrobacteraceae bacterium]